jgi:hypothetical protein
MSLAKAMSSMKKVGHSMSDAECKSCGGGPCEYCHGGKFADGGKASSDWDKVGRGIGADKLDKSKTAGFNPFGPAQASASDDVPQKAKGGMIKKDEGKIKYPSDEELEEDDNKESRMFMGDEKKGKGLIEHDNHIKRLADGGNVGPGGIPLDPAKGQQIANAFKAEGGEIEEDDGMLDHCAGELLSAIESKNKKEILDSIKAIVMSLKG